MTDRTWVLAPNDLALWDQCRRCFYLAAAAEFPRPVSPNRAASLIGRRLLSGLQGARADKIADGMPAGLVDVGRHPLRSAPLTVQVPDRAYRCVIRGDLDVVLRLDGKACGLAEVVVGAPEPAAVVVHARRLHAWAQTIEAPAAGESRTVRALGVLAFEPETDGPVARRSRLLWLSRRDALRARAAGAARRYAALHLVRLSRRQPPDGLLGRGGYDWWSVIEGRHGLARRSRRVTGFPGRAERRGVWGPSRGPHLNSLSGRAGRGGRRPRG